MDREPNKTDCDNLTQPAVEFVDGRLYSQTYHDYYADQDAIGECQRVHIAPTRLLERVQPSRCFTIFEFGFGAAVNFLTIAQEFLRYAPRSSRLRFISCENAPLQHDVLATVLARLDFQHRLVSEFLYDYPPLVAGIHRRGWANDKIELTLLFTTAEAAFQEFKTSDTQGVDAWILDGFTPDRNPDMWDPVILRDLASRTKSGGTISSFSVAGTVRRTLENSGFDVRRITHTNRKIHSLLATLNQSPYIPSATPKQVVVVGGGFAGTSVARALARRRVETKVITLTGTVADATSGIPAAVVHGRLSTSLQSSVQFRNHAYFFSQAWVRQLINVEPAGAMHIPCENMSWARLEGIAQLLGPRWCRSVDERETAEVVELPTPTKAVLFPRSLLVEGPALCRALAENSFIALNARPKYTSLMDSEETVIVIATAFLIREIEQYTSSIEMVKVLGQVDRFRATHKSYRSKLVLIQAGYAAPHQDSVWVGSTYEYHPWTNARATQHNLETLNGMVKQSDWQHQQSYRGTRAVTSDKLPIVGRVAPNIWLNLGHGSSGTTTAPFSAEILASQITGELPPILSTHLQAIHPRRFELRQQLRPNPFHTHKIVQERE